mmetsp:Transcript_3760/g.5093  ORF Transcript_3760/g.5093 Transcript_3760/m.5093 type:complete len:521 (+) Transcript_3760:3-1565(+)
MNIEKYLKSAKMSFMELKLTEAAAKGDLNEVEFCLNSNVNVNFQDHQGATALNIACARGRLEAVKLLLEKSGIDVNLKANSGKAPLLSATTAGHLDIVKELLRHPDIDPNVQDKFTTMVLLVAMRTQPKIYKELLNHAAINVNLQKKDGSTALMYAIDTGNTKAALELLMHPDIDLEITNDKGETALEIAERKGLRSVTAAFKGMMKGGGRKSMMRVSTRRDNDRISIARSFSQNEPRISREISMSRKFGSHQPRKSQRFDAPVPEKPETDDQKHPVVEKESIPTEKDDDVEKNKDEPEKKDDNVEKVKDAEEPAPPFKVNEEVVLAQRATSVPQINSVSAVDQGELKRFLERNKVGKILVNEGAENAGPIFIEKNVRSIELAAALSADDLKDMGITKFTQRTDLVNSFRAAAEQESSNANNKSEPESKNQPDTKKQKERSTSKPALETDDGLTDVERFLVRTEVGKILVESKLEEIAPKFVEKDLETISQASKLTAIDLKAMGLAKFSERSALLKKFTS